MPSTCIQFDEFSGAVFENLVEDVGTEAELESRDATRNLTWKQRTQLCQHGQAKISLPLKFQYSDLKRKPIS